MEIKKFEAYNYRGKELDVINRKEFLAEVYSQFESGKFLGYDINGTAYESNDEVLYIYVDKDGVGKVIKLDFSDLGIEIGNQEWNEEKEDMDDFQPERNLDTTETKQIKSYKKDIKNYNI